MAKMQKRMTQAEQRAEIQARLIAAPELSNRAVSLIFGCSHNTVAAVREALIKECLIDIVETPAAEDWRRHEYLKRNPNVMENPANLTERGLRAIRAPGVLDIMAERELTSAVYAQRVLNRLDKAARKNAAIELAAEHIIIKQDDLMTGLPWIEDSSVDLIATDLPYSREFLPLYKALSTLAGRVLKEDGGSLLCMTGQSALPDVLKALCEDERLRYHWTLTAVMPRAACNLNWLHVSSHTKPIIHMCKGAYSGDWYSDLITAKPADKDRDISWEQPLDVFDELLKRFIQRAGAVILDPCCGSGTSLLAGIRTGLCARVIGVDINAEAVKFAKKRVDDLLYSKNK